MDNIKYNIGQYSSCQVNALPKREQDSLENACRVGGLVQCVELVPGLVGFCPELSGVFFWPEEYRPASEVVDDAKYLYKNGVALK